MFTFRSDVKAPKVIYYYYLYGRRLPAIYLFTPQTSRGRSPHWSAAPSAPRAPDDQRLSRALGRRVSRRPRNRGRFVLAGCPLVARERRPGVKVATTKRHCVGRWLLLPEFFFSSKKGTDHSYLVLKGG